ncbi:uncharacterized protein LOC114122905 [Aphis gossypii]|uniref:uncharacterized protein LOC114122905 n=1 Tax=Aphis gossypii TaxID=80765 RepID=UPI002159AE77|nr:uncharacterized protein LOC114122905 [Aphis gossypii]
MILKKSERGTKRMPGENVQDEISSSASDRFRVNTYYKCLDQIILSIDNRFSSARDRMKDLALLPTERLIEAKHKSEMDLPDKCFLDLATWITDINPYQLKTEYSLFSKSLKELIIGMKFPDNQSKESSDINSEDEHQNIMSEPKQNITLETIINILSSFDIMCAFPNLYCAYKALCTIPASSASAERSFSKVKLIKTRLRSTMSQQRLESLMFISCERDIPIDINEVINKFGLSSSVLKKELMFG